MKTLSQLQVKLRWGAAALAALAASGVAMATPVTYQITLQATEGAQFGVSSPATFIGTFTVDSTFLAQADGTYSGSYVTNFYIVMGSQVFNAATAYNPDVQGVLLAGNQIVALGMNWYQTSAGLEGPFLQMYGSGSWVAGSTADQAGSAILQGGSGTQSFIQLSPANVIASNVAPVATDGQDGFYFIDAATGDLYGPKANGAWPGSPFSLVGPAGATGADGATGPAGSVGPAGPAGPAGSTGPTGQTGPAGAIGPAGPAGVAGPAGSAGSVGPAGPAGPAGSTGPAGQTGPAGAIGPAGPSGSTGPAGSVGPAGPAGATGSAGPAGPAGAVGPAGAAGKTGATGPEGPAGAVGPAGPAGATGKTGATGPEGPAGPAGPAGPGLVSGSLLFLAPGKAAPAGYTKIGTTVVVFTSPKLPETITVYQKN